VSLLLVLACLPLASAPQEETPKAERATLAPGDAREARDRALAWLVENQREDGGWATGSMDTVQEYFFSVESFYAWKVAADAIATMALRAAPETSERRAALDRAVERLCGQRIPQRGSDWDTDYGWGVLYAFVCTLDLADDRRFQSDEDQTRLRATAENYLEILQRIQSPNGGWAYYDDPIFSRRPTWDTSFCTALVIPSLVRAVERGWLEDESVLDRAVAYVRRCALPNGAFAYSWTAIPRLNGGESINDVKGSLSRIQVCNLALVSAGVEKVTPDRVKEGVTDFFRYHKFLDAARMRPIPHEAYYANAGYFYMFGHYYAAQAIQLLPSEEREMLHAQLRPHLVRAQRPEGYALDFIDTSYERVACTGFLALGLSLGLSDE